MWDDEEDNIFVYSGDIGTTCWVLQNDDQWVKQDPFTDTHEKPELLEQLIGHKNNEAGDENGKD